MRQRPRRRYASLPWYDLPEMHAANDGLWLALAARLAADGINDVPRVLDRSRPPGIDAEGNCLFTQTCGYPLLTTANGHFTVLAAPRYAAAGCDGWLHRSFIVVRDDAAHTALEELRGTRFAMNEPDSNSGMNLPRRLFAPLARDGRFFGSTLVTGSHAASAAAVADGRADAAALDCVTYAFLKRYRPAATRRLRVIAETHATPAPPFVTSQVTKGAEIGALREALHWLMTAEEHAPLREALLLGGIEFCDATAYDVIARYEREAAELRYPVVR